MLEHRYCQKCEDRFKHVIRIISLVNGNTDLLMTVLTFKELFTKVLLPLFSPDHFDSFCEGA